MERNLEPYLQGEKVEHRGLFSDIHTLENNPNYLAKKLMLDFDQFHDGENPHSYKERITQFVQEASQIKQYYGDLVPEFHIAIAAAEWQNEDKHPDGTPIIFMKKVVRTIDRSPKDDVTYEVGLDELYCKQIELFLATYDGEEGLVPEIFKTKNLIYGKTDTDKESKLYFIDLYPVYHWGPDELIKLIDSQLVFGSDRFPKTQKVLQKLQNLIKK